MKLKQCSHYLISQLNLQARYRRYTSQTYEKAAKLVSLLDYSLPLSGYTKQAGPAPGRAKGEVLSISAGFLVPI